MQTQRDRVAAYNTLVGRMSAALLLGRTTYEEPPTRRVWFGLLVGFVVGALVAGGMGVYGLVRPHASQAWKRSLAVLVDKDSGARMLYLGGQLVPVLNTASARLRLGTVAQTEVVSSEQLAGTPRIASAIGIPGAPDSVPSPSQLVTDGWVLCLPRTGARASAATGDLSVMIASDVENLVSDGRIEALPANKLLWLAGSDGRQWLLGVEGRKLLVPTASAAVALGLVPGSAVSVPDAFLTSVPDGPALVPPPYSTAPDAPPPNAKVADPISLFDYHSPSGSVRYLMRRSDGLATISMTQSALLQAAGAPAPVAMSAAELASAKISAQPDVSVQIPDVVGRTPMALGHREFCLGQQDDGVTVRSSVLLAVPGLAGSGLSEGTAAPSPGAVAAVASPSGMLVRADSVADPSGAGPTYLITDTGRKYLIADADALKALGYGGVTPQYLPARILALVPEGPQLSRQAVGVRNGG